MNLAAIGALPWKELLLLAPGMVETGRRLYESLRTRNRKLAEEETASLDSLPAPSDELKALQSKLDEIASSQAQLAELIAQMTTQEEALAHGIQIQSDRLTRLFWVSGSAVVIAVVAVVLAFLLRS